MRHEFSSRIPDWNGKSWESESKGCCCCCSKFHWNLVSELLFLVSKLHQSSQWQSGRDLRTFEQEPANLESNWGLNWGRVGAGAELLFAGVFQTLTRAIKLKMHPNSASSSLHYGTTPASSPPLLLPFSLAISLQMLDHNHSSDASSRWLRDRELARYSCRRPSNGLCASECNWLKFSGPVRNGVFKSEGMKEGRKEGNERVAYYERGGCENSIRSCLWRR